MHRSKLILTPAMKLARKEEFIEKIFDHIRDENNDLSFISAIQKFFTHDVVQSALNEYCLYQSIGGRKTFLIIKRSHQFDCMVTKFTIIHWLAYLEKFELLRFFLGHYRIDLELKVNFYDNSLLICGVTPLWMASFKRHPKIMALFLENCADPNTSCDSGESPLSLVTRNLPLTKLLIEHKASVNQANIMGYTPLITASCYCQLKTVQELLKNGADPSLTAYDGSTALHHAAEQGKLDVVKELLNHGAKFTTNNVGNTPLFVAALNHNTEIIDFFLNIPNLFSLKDQIATYELLAAGMGKSDLGSEMRTAKIFEYLRKSLVLRYCSSSLDSLGLIKVESIKFNPEELPKHPRYEIDPYVSRLGSTVKTIGELERMRFDNEKLLFECLLIFQNYYGTSSLEYADALFSIGTHLMDEFGLDSTVIDVWSKAIKIKIENKVFIGKVFESSTECLYRNHREYPMEGPNYLKFVCQMGVSLINLAIQYFNSRPLPSCLKTLTFQLNAYHLTETEYFKKSKMINECLNAFRDVYYDRNEHDDINCVMESILTIIRILTTNFRSSEREDKVLIKNAIEELLRINIINSNCGRHLLHMVFINLKIEISVGVHAVLRMLYRCGVNTVVFDTGYNSPLHYLAYHCMKTRTPLRTLNQSFQRLTSHVSYGTFIANPSESYHFDYADQNRVHLDAVNCYNQTAYDINPAFFDCDNSCQSLRIFPLKCLAARAAHFRWLRCNMCKSPLDFWEECNERRKRKWNNLRFWRRLPDSLDDFYRDIHEMGFQNEFEEDCELMESRNYSLKKQYRLHLPKKYDAQKIRPFVQQACELLGINVKLLEFIEMHGPCKFVNLV